MINYEAIGDGLKGAGEALEHLIKTDVSAFDSWTKGPLQTVLNISSYVLSLLALQEPDYTTSGLSSFNADIVVNQGHTTHLFCSLTK